MATPLEQVGRRDLHRASAAEYTRQHDALVASATVGGE
jgi:hypothetical protein